MARVTQDIVEATRNGLLEAARTVLMEHGYSGLSTRRVAEAAGAPMSQIQYHFGSKQGLVLALFEHMNADLLRRQEVMFSSDLALSAQWDLACDYLEEDLKSGYVRVTQELIAAGWSNPDIRDKAVAGLRGWQTVLQGVAERTLERFGPLGPFTAREVASLVGSAFLGAEAKILLGLDDGEQTTRTALRRVGEAIRLMEQNSGRT